jgi:hypothetical protein
VSSSSDGFSYNDAAKGSHPLYKIIFDADKGKAFGVESILRTSPTYRFLLASSLMPLLEAMTFNVAIYGMDYL